MTIFDCLQFVFLFFPPILITKSGGHTVTQECYIQKHNSSFKSPHCTHPEGWVDKFDRLDSDGNGWISFVDYHNEDACFIDNLAHWFCRIDLDADKNRDNWISFDELAFSEESEARLRKEFDFLGNSKRFGDFYVEPTNEEEEDDNHHWWDIFGWFDADDEEQTKEPETLYYVTKEQWTSMGANGEVFYTVLYQGTFDYRMPLSQEDVDSRMMKFHNEFQEAWKTKDIKSLASMYHPEGTLVAAGYWVARGPQEIEERFRDCFKVSTEVKFNFTTKQATENGEYLFQRGTFEPADGSGMIGKFESIFKQQPDGKYLVYHDEFSFQQ
ncbi:hypothetical protein FO519_001640 [Halicephalobus sp. NKZ332]|nr:hypothetical protein FO519_001640 [Halicephalobus sp. NKZ332]